MYTPRPEEEKSGIVVTEAIKDKVAKENKNIDEDPIKLEIVPPNKNGMFRFNFN